MAPSGGQILQLIQVTESFSGSVVPVAMFFLQFIFIFTFIFACIFTEYYSDLFLIESIHHNALGWVPIGAKDKANLHFGANWGKQTLCINCCISSVRFLYSFLPKSIPGWKTWAGKGDGISLQSAHCSASLALLVESNIEKVDFFSKILK